MLMSILVPATIAVASFLIVVEILKLNRLIRIVKPIASTLVIAIALTAFLIPGSDFIYALLIVSALVFSLVGDILLMPPDRETKFRLGLLSFLTAHVLYILAFWPMAGWSIADAATGSVLLLLGAAFYFVIRKKLGRLKLPVVFYMAVICLMVNRAAATGSLQIGLGAALFFISDIMLAFARFRRHWKYERISLAFYYGGQILLALSASLAN